MTDQGATLRRPFRRDPRERSRKIASSPTARATTLPSSASNFYRSPGWRPWSEAPRRRERERAAKAGWLETIRELRDRPISSNGPCEIHDARPSVLPPSRPLHWPRPGWRSSSAVLSTRQEGRLVLPPKPVPSSNARGSRVKSGAGPAGTACLASPSLFDALTHDAGTSERRGWRGAERPEGDDESGDRQERRDPGTPVSPGP